MTDEQIAMRIVSDARYNEEIYDDMFPEKLYAAIVQALRDARKAPRGSIIDDQGVVRKLLGTLPVTADGCVVGDGASPAFWHDGNVLLEGCMGCEPSAVFADPNVPAMLFSLNDGVKVCYSTREAAEAAKEAKE